MRCGSTRTRCSATSSRASCCAPLLATSYAATSLAAYGEAEWPLSRSIVADRRAARRDALGRLRRLRRRALRPARHDGRWPGVAAGAARCVEPVVRDGRPRLQGGRLQHRAVRAGRPAPVRRPSTSGTRSPGLRFANADAATAGRRRGLLHVARGPAGRDVVPARSRRSAVVRVLSPTTPRSGRNYGLEASLAWQARRALERSARRWACCIPSTSATSYGDRDLDGREQAHAPGYQYSLSAQWGGGQGLDGARRPERLRRVLLRRQPRPALGPVHACST